MVNDTIVHSTWVLWFSLYSCTRSDPTVFLFVFPLAFREAMDPEVVSSTIRSATSKAAGSMDGKQLNFPFWLCDSLYMVVQNVIPARLFVCFSPSRSRGHGYRGRVKYYKKRNK
jgi:hypothetical protein